jgi:putative Holliday junction resolvase
VAITAIGLDVGTRHIGVARGDDDVRFAVPLASLVNDTVVFERIRSLIAENHAGAVVVGLPRGADGQETKQSQFSRDFANQLAEFTGVKIVLQDESLTSVQAEKNLRSRRDFNEKMLRDGTLDSEAAALILTDYLENGVKNAVA